MNVEYTRPILNIPLSPYEIAIEIISIAGILASILAVIIYWPILPERIPVHFGFDGTPNGWGTKNTIITLPTIIILSYIGFTLLGRYPHIYNYPFALTPENVRQQYEIARTMISLVKLEFVWIFTLIEWQVIRISLGKAQSISTWIILAITIIPLITVAFGIYRAYVSR